MCRTLLLPKVSLEDSICTTVGAVRDHVDTLVDDLATVPELGHHTGGTWRHRPHAKCRPEVENLETFADEPRARIAGSGLRADAATLI